MQEEKIVIDGNRVTIQEIDRIACNKANVVLSEDETWKNRIAKGPESIKNRIDSGNSLYGVTTGFGDSVDRSVSPEMAEKL